MVSFPGKFKVPRSKAELLLRDISLGLSVIAIGLSLGVQTLPGIILSTLDNAAAVITSDLISLTNSDRNTNSLLRLHISPLLQKAAQLKADDMAAKGYFAHTSPEGTTPWHWFAVAGYDYVNAGENLAIDYFESADVEKAWMNSPFHRANILNNMFTEIGIATATSTYNGHQTTVVVQLFGRPMESSDTDTLTEDTVISSSPTFTAVTKEARP